VIDATPLVIGVFSPSNVAPSITHPVPGDGPPGAAVVVVVVVVAAVVVVVVVGIEVSATVTVSAVISIVPLVLSFLISIIIVSVPSDKKSSTSVLVNVPCLLG
jgi:hypothetical protein